MCARSPDVQKRATRCMITAKAIDLTIPESFLNLADEVIE
jgi:hypothetical protein